MRKSKLFEQHGHEKRTVKDVVEEKEMGYARLKDYHHGKKVELMWDRTPEMSKDQIFILKVHGKQETIELYLDWEEVQRFLRWV